MQMTLLFHLLVVVALPNRFDGKEAGIKRYDWFFCTKPMNKEDVLNKIK
jgi:hypothetical protein